MTRMVDYQQYKDVLETASHAELYQFARGVLMDLVATYDFVLDENTSIDAGKIWWEIESNFAVSFPDKL